MRKYYIMIKEAIHQEDISIMSIYVLNIKESNLQSKQGKKQGDKYITAQKYQRISIMNKTSTEKINKDLNKNCRQNGINRHVQNVTPNSTRIHILLSTHGTCSGLIINLRKA